jgi:hypothetical protein
MSCDLITVAFGFEALPASQHDSSENASLCARDDRFCRVWALIDPFATGGG